MKNIISWYVWWQNIVRREGEKDIVIEERRTKEFTNHYIMAGFEEGKKAEGYETGHGYWLNIP